MREDQLTPNTASRYHELDALRGVAAVLVVFFHFTLNRPEAQWGFRLGTTGVDLFFIISGFVIFMTLRHVQSVGEFLGNRAARLYPTYWAIVTFTFFVRAFFPTVALPKPSLTQYLGNLTMFQYYMWISDLDAPYWTMLVEMLFYFAMVAVFVLKLRRWLEPLGLFVAVGAAALATLAPASRPAIYLFGYLPLLTFWPLFLAGIVYHQLYTTKQQQLPRIAALIVCLLCQFQLFRYGRSHDYISPTEYLLTLVIYFGLFALFVTNRLRWLVSAPTLFLGRISFALYLIHEYVATNVVIPYLTQRLHLSFWVAAGGISFPLVVVLAFLVTEYIEVPARRKRRAKLHQLLT